MLPSTVWNVPHISRLRFGNTPTFTPVSYTPNLELSLSFDNLAQLRPFSVLVKPQSISTGTDGTLFWKPPSGLLTTVLSVSPHPSKLSMNPVLTDPKYKPISHSPIVYFSFSKDQKYRLTSFRIRNSIFVVFLGLEHPFLPFLLKVKPVNYELNILFLSFLSFICQPVHLDLKLLHRIRYDD